MLKFRLLVACFWTFQSGTAFAAWTWCYPNVNEDGVASLPCNGASGRCTLNRNGSRGGFVADTATIEKIAFISFLNKPHLGRYAQVCDRARVSGDSAVRGHAVISDSAMIMDRAIVKDRARVYGNARVRNCAKIQGNAQVFDFAQVFNRATVSGNARLHGVVTFYGRSYLGGNNVLNGGVRAPVHTPAVSFVFGSGESGSGDSDENQALANLVSPSVLRPVTAHTLARLENDRSLLLLIGELQDKLTRLEIKSENETNQNEILSVSKEIQLIRDQLEICPVCIETLESKKKLVETQCNHLFCQECFVGRPLRKSNTCPLCRKESWRKDATQRDYPEIERYYDSLPASLGEAEGSDL